MVENWLPVLGSEYHQVSDLGQVRSVDYVLVDSLGRRNPIKGRLLIPIRNQLSGKLSVKIKNRSRYIHHLVLESFVGPRPDGLMGLHTDDDPQNNALSNLRWGTRSDNSHDSVRNGNHVQARKTRCINGHEYSGQNLAHDTKGKRVCRQCSRDNTRRYRARRAAQ